MKGFLAFTSLLLAPLGAHAACSPADFKFQDFTAGMSTSGIGQRILLKGELVNQCAEPAAAQIAIVAKDASGKVLTTKKGWPAGTSNIAPGQSVSFDLGRLFRNTSNMATYSVDVASVRTW